MTDNNSYYYVSVRAEWNSICAYIRNHKHYNTIKNMRIAPDRASAARIQYEKQLERTGTNANI